jgi:HEAT repeat protein
MHRILVFSILAIAALFLGFTAAIVAGKAWREGRERRRRARSRALEPVVLGWVHHDDPSLLARLGGRVRLRDRRALESLLLEHVQRVRGAEGQRLARALDELGYVDEYIAALHHRSWWRRAWGAERLALTAARRATPALVAALEDPIEEVRLRAAKAFAALGGVSAIRPLLATLGGGSRWFSLRAADVLATLGGGLVPQIVEAFPGLDPRARVAAVEILGRSRRIEAAPWLLQRLRDPETDVRARACDALASIGATEAGPALVRALSDPMWPVRAVAARALGRLRHEAATPGLCEAMRDRQWWVRANAAEALKAMGDPGLAALDGMLDGPDGFARHLAVQMLEESGVVDLRIEDLALDESELRRSAELLVARLVRAGRTDRLRELGSAHRDARVRESLGALLPAGDRAGAAAP